MIDQYLNQLYIYVYFYGALIQTMSVFQRFKLHMPVLWCFKALLLVYIQITDVEYF